MSFMFSQRLYWKKLFMKKIILSHTLFQGMPGPLGDRGEDGPIGAEVKLHAVP